MKKFVSVAMLAAGLLAVSEAALAQDCSSITTWDLRGTYSMTGNGWVDLSKLLAGVPGLPALPAQLIPMTWVGATAFNGAGVGSGWVSFNGGGSQMTASFVNLNLSIQSDCRIQLNFSLKVKELGSLTIGPFQRLAVPAGKGDSLEAHMIWQGNPPGAPTGAAVDSGTARRLSMQF